MITITSFTPSSGAAATNVTITGSGLQDCSDVQFNGVSAAFSVSDDSTVSATVPSGASTGPVTVVAQDSSKATSTEPFIVAIVVTPANPLTLQGPTGTYDEIDIEGGQIWADQTTTVTINTLKKIA